MHVCMRARVCMCVRETSPDCCYSYEGTVGWWMPHERDWAEPDSDWIGGRQVGLREIRILRRSGSQTQWWKLFKVSRLSIGVEESWL